MSSFRKALLCTAIPIVVVALIGIAFAPIWPVAAVFAVIAFVIGIILLFMKGHRQTAAGILAGIAIGIIALGATCFAINKIVF